LGDGFDRDDGQQQQAEDSRHMRSRLYKYKPMPVSFKGPACPERVEY
jgi:hypothetical protein